MSLDITVLRALKSRDRYEKLARSVPRRALDERGIVLLDDMGAFFREFPDVKVLDTDAFATWFRAYRHPAWKDDAVLVYNEIINRMREDASPELEAGIMQRLVAARAAADLTDLLTSYNEGDELDLGIAMRTVVESYEQSMERKVKNPQVLTPIEELLSREENDIGLQWRLPILNAHIKPIRAGDFVVIAARPDKGKCQSPDTPVLLADGRTVRADEVVQGDILAGPFMSNEVLSTIRGTGPMYRVEYPWGESYVVNDAHILSLKRSKAEGVHKHGDILNVSVEEYVTWPDSKKGRYKGWKSGIDLPEATQVVPPYILGAWLGDGTTCGPGVTTMDGELLEAFTREYGEPSRVVPAGKASTYFFPGKFSQGLRDLGVMGDKHIPDSYLRASREQRLQLLAGLIDSDGHAGDVYEMVTQLDTLAEQYVWLARSLGFHATVNKTFKRATNSPGHAGSWYNRVRIGAEAFGEVPVRLTRKLGNTKARKRKGLHFGLTVTPVGTGEYVGWTLTGDRLYMLGDFTVTHNTTFIADQLTHMAGQVDKLYPDEGRSIVWLNNEGPGDNIVLRTFQAALGITTEDMVKRSKQPSTDPTRWRTALHQQYAESLGGRSGVLRVFDIHGMNHVEVEDLLLKHKPAAVVYDMIDNIRFEGALANGGQRTDQVLETMYQWARMKAVQLNFSAFATSQISAEGDGMPFPTLPMLKDSKCFAPGTLVRMHSGEVRTIESIRVGEYVMGLDGTPRKVIGTGEGEEEMFRVSGNGWHFDCNLSHNLTVTNTKRKTLAGVKRGELVRMPLTAYLAGKTTRLLSAVTARLPYSHKDLPMDPYLFGLWLGDGAQRECRITTGDPEILAYLESLPSYRSTYKQGSNCSDVFFGPRSWLKGMGVWMNKRIPAEYKRASIPQRQALLAGLMDSDGTVDHGSSVISMSNKRAALVDDIAEVARSLGYRASTRHKAANNSYSVTFLPTDALPCLLPRKVHKGGARGDMMQVRPLGRGRYVGITVDTDSRYVLANGVVVENTGKQGAADVILTIGSSNDPMLEQSRWLGCTKNKRVRTGVSKSPQAEVIFSGDRARYFQPE